MAANRASRSVVRYPDVVPIDACPKLFCTTWIGTPLPPGRQLSACEPWVCLKGSLCFRCRKDLNPSIRPSDSFDGSVVLLDDVVQVLRLAHLDGQAAVGPEA